MHSSVRAHHNFIPQTGLLHLVYVTNCLEPLSYAHLERADRNDIDKAIVLSTDDLVFIDLAKSADPCLRSDVLDAFEVLLDIEYLHLVLPRAHKDKFLSQVQAFSKV